MGQDSSRKPQEGRYVSGAPQGSENFGLYLLTRTHSQGQNTGWPPLAGGYGTGSWAEGGGLSQRSGPGNLRMSWGGLRASQQSFTVRNTSYFRAGECQGPEIATTGQEKWDQEYPDLWDQESDGFLEEDVCWPSLAAELH